MRLSKLFMRLKKSLEFTDGGRKSVAGFDIMGGRQVSLDKESTIRKLTQKKEEDAGSTDP